MTRRRLSVALVVAVLLGGCSPAETPETPETAPDVHDMELEPLQQRAEQGHADAQSRLGAMYYAGEGVPQDYVEAMTWYRLAADQGNAGAQVRLGIMYNGEVGVPLDYVESARLYRLAAEQGNAFAQSWLGYKYEFGEGVPQDYVEAHKWYNLTASRATGDYQSWRGRGWRERYADERDALAKRLTPAQLAEAQKLAREWQAAFDARQ